MLKRELRLFILTTSYTGISRVGSIHSVEKQCLHHRVEICPMVNASVFVCTVYKRVLLRSLDCVVSSKKCKSSRSMYPIHKSGTAKDKARLILDVTSLTIVFNFEMLNLSARNSDIRLIGYGRLFLQGKR